MAASAMKPQEAGELPAPRPKDAAGSVWLVGAALLILYCWRLGASPLFDVDEGAFAQASREMLDSGDWGHTTLNGVDRFDKPILVYWLQAASLWLLGPSEFAARLPSALSLLAATAGVAWFSSKRWGRQTALRTAFMLGSTLGLLLIGRASTADGLLNALLIGTGLLLWDHLESGRRSSLRGAYALAALALLTKGPIGILIPGATLVIWSLLNDRGRSLARAASDPWAWMLLILIAAPWYLYAMARHGDTFIEGFFLRHNLQRFSSPLEGHSGGLGYYLIVVPIALLPWTPLVLANLTRWRCSWSQPLDRFLWIWALFVIGFFSLAGTKLPHYALYAVAPLIVLSGRDWPLAPAWSRIAVWITLLFQALVAGGVPIALAFTDLQGIYPWAASLLQELPPSQELLAATAWVAGVILLCAVVRRLSLDLRLLIATCAVNLLWTAGLVPWVGEVLQGPFRQAGRWAQERGIQLNAWRMNVPSVAFYMDQPLKRGAPQAGNWILQRADRPFVEHAVSPPAFESRGLSIVQRQP